MLTIAASTLLLGCAIEELEEKKVAEKSKEAEMLGESLAGMQGVDARGGVTSVGGLDRMSPPAMGPRRLPCPGIG